MKKKNLYIVLGVVAVALVGYAYLVSIDVDGDDESFNGEEGDLRCGDYTPYTCSPDGEVNFRDPDGNEVQITEECCNELGYTFGGNATTGKNACMCDTPGQDIIDWTRPTT